jgi:hypothetical protein
MHAPAGPMWNPIAQSTYWTLGVPASITGSIAAWLEPIEISDAMASGAP